MNNYRRIVAEDLKLLRHKNTWTQEKLAKMFNAAAPRSLQTTQKDICLYEKGKTACPADKYFKFISL